MENEIIRGKGPTAAKSKIGYLLSGSIKTASSSTFAQFNMSILKVIVSNEPENKDLKRFWALESIRILQDATSSDNVKFLREYQNSSVHLENGQYCTKLLWKNNHPSLPTNEAVALGRTRSTICRSSRDLNSLAIYSKIIQEQLKRKFIKKVDDLATVHGCYHYIPHHPVFKESSTTPLLIVYDCSCSPNTNQSSLNSCLSIGPDILNDMTGILLCFRCHRYGITADIKKAFLNISLHATDRDATRFFWLSDPTDPKRKFDDYRFQPILLGASCSPFILNAMIKKHLDSSSDLISNHTKSDIYIDNLVSGADDENKAVNYFVEARFVMTPVNFNLHSWNSNRLKFQTQTADKGFLDSDPECKG